MFTGIVESLGTVEHLEDLGDSVRITISDDRVLGDAELGASIAVNGCCLTVAAFDLNTHENADRGAFVADVMAETLDKTTIGLLRVGDLVNLERAVTPTTRLGGHLVQGHVDGTGTIRRRTPSEHWELVEIATERAFLKHLVEKGSITVDGVSLTVVDVLDDPSAPGFTVSLIPETLARTTLGTRAVGDRVNLEADVIAKHVARLLSWRDA